MTDRLAWSHNLRRGGGNIFFYQKFADLDKIRKVHSTRFNRASSTGVNWSLADVDPLPRWRVNNGLIS